MKKTVLVCALAAVFALSGIMAGCDNETDKNADVDNRQEEEMPEQKPNEGEGQKPGEGEEQKPDEGEGEGEGQNPNEGEEQNPGEGEEERKLRVLDKDFKYEVVQRETTIKYGEISLYGVMYRPKPKGKYPSIRP